jgi:hypothetical protein
MEREIRSVQAERYLFCRVSKKTEHQVRELKMRAFWGIAPCSLVDRRSRGSTHVWNVGLLKRDYMALYLRRLLSSYSPPWESEISQSKTTFNFSSFYEYFSLSFHCAVSAARVMYVLWNCTTIMNQGLRNVQKEAMWLILKCYLYIA